MICEEERVDLRLQDPKSIEEGKRLAKLAFRLNHTMPMTDEYQEIDLKVHGNIVNEQGQVVKSTITVKTSDDGVNFQPFQSVTTNDYGYYSFSHNFYDRCKKVRFVVSDEKNYYLPDSVDLQLNYANGGTLYEVEEFNFTLSPRIEF